MKSFTRMNGSPKVGKFAAFGYPETETSFDNSSSSNTLGDIVNRFIDELKKAKAPIKFDISKLKQRYND